MPLFLKKKSWQIAILISFLILLFSGFYYSPKGRELVFHPIWTEVDKQQITELAETWVNGLEEQKQEQKGSLQNFANALFEFRVDYIYNLQEEWNIYQQERDWLQLFSIRINTIYETAKSGNPVYVGEKNCTLINLACAHEKIELALHLIESGAPLNLFSQMKVFDESEPEEWNASPLMLAVTGGGIWWGHGRYAELPNAYSLGKRLILIEALAKKGADMNIPVYDDVPIIPGILPLIMKKEENKKELINLLLNNGADINRAYGQGNTPLMLICENLVTSKNTLDDINVEIARMFLDHGANPILKDHEGNIAWDRLKHASPELKQQILEKLPELKPSSSNSL